MGFSPIWHFINGQSFKQSPLNWTNIDDVAKKPWIIIDWNNFVMNIAPLVGGHISIVERRCQLVFNALAKCGARICIISDGSFQSVERSCIKLGRIHQRMSRCIDVNGEQIHAPSESIDSDSLISDLAYHIADTAFRNAFPMVSHNVEDAQDDSTMYIYHTADGEADGEIRLFIRRMTGKDVLLLSKDGSLLLGVPSRRLYVINMDTIALQSCTNIQGGYMAIAKVCHVHKLLQCLNEESNKIVGVGISYLMHDVNDTMLVWIAALLGGETSYERRGQPDDPTPLLYYLSAFLLTRDDQDRIKKPILSLLIATVAVRAWYTSSSSATNNHDITTFIMEIKHNAETILKMIQKDRRSKPSVLFGMICSLPRQTIPPPVTFLQNSASNLLHNKPGCSGGLADSHTCHAIARELQSRHRAELDLPSVATNASRSGVPTNAKKYHASWGKWTWMEGVAEDTELLLSPLNSLVKQLRFASKFAIKSRDNPLELKSAAGMQAPEDTPLSIPGSVDGPILIEDLNHYIRSLFLPTEGSEIDDMITESHNQTIRTRKIKHMDRPDVKDTRKTSSQHSTVSTEPSTVFVRLERPLQSYRVLQLLQTPPHAFPSCGIIVDDVSDSFGLYFHTCCDTLEAEGVYCLSGTDHLYSTSQSRPLLNLKNRMRVIDRVLREEGFRPSLESTAISAIDRVTSLLMRVLGLAPIPTHTHSSTHSSTSHVLPIDSDDDYDALNRRVDSVCAEIGAFWSQLPGTESAKTHLLTTDPGLGPARVVFATLYAFASLLKESLNHRLKRKFEVVLSAITTALLLCPCFALTSGHDLTDVHITAYVDPFTGKQNRVDLTASHLVFKEKLEHVAKCFVVEGATKAVDRLSHLAESVLNSIVSLLQITCEGSTEVDWVCLTRWFNLMGMQFTLGHWEVEGSTDVCYARVCEVNGMPEGRVGEQKQEHSEVLSAVVANIVSVIIALTD